MWTRQDYLHKRCTHRQWYAQFVTEACRELVKSRFGIERLSRAADDPTLNGIPLRGWGALEPMIRHICDRKALEEADSGWWSLATAVCIAKEAARQVVEREMGEVRAI